MKKKTSIVKNVSDFLRSKKANNETCQIIIDKCKKWMEGSRQREIEDIDKQISELQKKKDIIINNY